MAEREYLLGHSEEETQRLIQQAQRLDLPLRRLFEDAGIGSGIRVLDLGSGAGAVALMAAEFVGEAGSVVGVDSESRLLDTARERALAAGYTNVSFVVGDLNQDLHLDGEFDAVVGRLVLIHLADPAATLRRVLRFVRPGGIVAFQEPSVAMPSPQERAFPPSSLLERLFEWRNQLFGKTGVELVMGFKLYQTFLEAGLPTPQIRAHASVYAGEQGIASFLQTFTLRTLRPMLLQHGIATEEELDQDAIAERLRAEFSAERKVAIGNLHFDAWARKP